MDLFVALVVMALICYAAYNAGKQLGSRRGYGVGRCMPDGDKELRFPIILTDQRAAHGQPAGFFCLAIRASASPVSPKSEDNIRPAQAS